MRGAHTADFRAGFTVVLLSAVLAAVRAQSAPPPPRGPDRQLSQEERVATFAALASSEPTWRREAEIQFPGDVWSQDDDFHRREGTFARETATTRGVPVEEVLRAIDEGLHGELGMSHQLVATVPPCKPRPFYD